MKWEATISKGAYLIVYKETKQDPQRRILQKLSNSPVGNKFPLNILANSHSDLAQFKLKSIFYT